MEIEAASVESTAEGDYLNIESDGEIIAFELTVDGANELISALREWLREQAEQ